MFRRIAMRVWLCVEIIVAHITCATSASKLQI